MNQFQISKRLERFYDIDSSRYRDAQWFSTASARSFYNNTKELLLSELQLNQSHSLLEIGCGPGTWTKLLAPIVKEIVAVDLSSEMIKQAREYVDRSNVRYLHGDFLSFNFENAQFDRIASVRVLEYFVDPEAVMNKCYRLLKPGGRAVFITKSASLIWRYRGSVLNYFNKLGMLGPSTIENIPAERGYDRLFWQKLLNPVRLKSIVAKCGFNNCWLLPVQVRLPIVSSGFQEFPILSGKSEERYLKFSEYLTRRINRMPSIISLLAISFSECYALILER